MSSRVINDVGKCIKDPWTKPKGVCIESERWVWVVGERKEGNGDNCNCTTIKKKF